MNRHLGLFTIVMLASTTAPAMEPKGAQSPPQNTIRKVICVAVQEKTPVSRERLTAYGNAISQTQEITQLMAAMRPSRIAMASDNLAHEFDDISAKLNTVYWRTWAPWTGAAAAACCVLSFLKPYCYPGVGDEQCQQITLLSAGYWAAQTRERAQERLGATNGLRVLELVDNQANAISKEKTRYSEHWCEQAKKILEVRKEAYQKIQEVGWVAAMQTMYCPEDLGSIPKEKYVFGSIFFQTLHQELMLLMRTVQGHQQQTEVCNFITEITQPLIANLRGKQFDDTDQVLNLARRILDDGCNRLKTIYHTQHLEEILTKIYFKATTIAREATIDRITKTCADQAGLNYSLDEINEKSNPVEEDAFLKVDSDYRSIIKERPLLLQAKINDEAECLAQPTRKLTEEEKKKQ
ncbi:MAG: hypothetical protein AB7F19_05740 [Candidatus Babeliales bacterium]